MTILLISILNTAEATSTNEPLYDKIYRSIKISESYYFLLLTKSGKLYYLHTNKTHKLTPSEIKSPNLLEILNQKQTWGTAFLENRKFIEKNGNLYTKRYWDIIKVKSPQKIKYLNKNFSLQ